MRDGLDRMRRPGPDDDQPGPALTVPDVHEKSVAQPDPAARDGRRRPEHDEVLRQDVDRKGFAGDFPCRGHGIVAEVRC